MNEYGEGYVNAGALQGVAARAVMLDQIEKQKAAQERRSPQIQPPDQCGIASTMVALADEIMHNHELASAIEDGLGICDKSPEETAPRPAPASLFGKLQMAIIVLREVNQKLLKIHNHIGG